MTLESENLALAAVHFLEAAYVWTQSDDEWLNRVLSAACAVWGPDPWAYAYLYDATDTSDLRVFSVQTRDVPPELAKLIRPMTERFPSQMVAKVFRSSPFGFGSTLGVHSPVVQDTLERFGANDTFALNGLDPEGRGCLVFFGTLRTHLLPERVALFHRLAAHLAAAYRCRRRIQSAGQPFDGAEAILDSEGRVLDAWGPGRTSREAIATAASEMQEIRRYPLRSEPTVRWRPRVQARWTITEAPGPNGDAYMVARENLAATPFLGRLTERERQVVSSAAFGRSNKEIAYDLGISHSTARVLLSRACSRLGVSSRAELLDLPILRAMRGGVDAGNPSTRGK